MSKFLTHILYTIFRFGTVLTVFFIGFTAQANASFQQESVLQEDTSDVAPKTYPTDFKERYTSSDYAYEEEKTKGWFSRFIDWLEAWIEDVFDFESRNEAANFLDNLTNIFYIIVIIIVVFIIVRAIMNGEGRWVFGKRSDKKMIRHEDIITNIHTVNFSKLISEAIENNDYRLAIRYQYLQMLKKMSASEIISYDPEKTNLDYTYEIKNEAIRTQFQYTSYVYNYVWYGEFAIDKAQYEQAQTSFNLILKNMAA